MVWVLIPPRLAREGNLGGHVPGLGPVTCGAARLLVAH